MKIIFFLFLIGSVMSSCQSCRDSGNTLKEIPLHSEGLLKNTDLFVKWAFKVKVQDSLLCIWDLHGGDKFYHLYSYPGLEFITSFAVNGRGPEEYVSTCGFTFDGHNNINVWDIARARLSIYSIDSLCRQRTSPARIINYPEVVVPIYNFANTENGFVLVNFDGKNRITLVDTCGNVLAQKYNIPWGKTQANSKQQDIISSLWDSFLDYNPENHILAIVTKLGEVLEIYNLSTDSSRIIVGKGGEPDFMRSKKFLSVGKIDGYLDVQVTKNAIYTLFSGQDRAEMFKQEAQGIHTPDGGKVVRVYDFEGRIIGNYLLEHYAMGIDVHEESQTMYTVNSSSEYTISKYALPGLKRYPL